MNKCLYGSAGAPANHCRFKCRFSKETAANCKEGAVVAPAP
jgi:hypothetical protein